MKKTLEPGRFCYNKAYLQKYVTTYLTINLFSSSENRSVLIRNSNLLLFFCRQVDFIVGVGVGATVGWAVFISQNPGLGDSCPPVKHIVFNIQSNCDGIMIMIS